MSDERSPCAESATGKPRWQWVGSEVLDALGSAVRCLDCGALVLAGDKLAHERFHSILAGHAWALAVLKTRHIAAHVHDRYDVVERIDSKRFDSWSADAFAEVTEEPTHFDGYPATD